MGDWVAGNSTVPVDMFDCGANIGAQLARRININNKLNILFVLITIHKLLQPCGEKQISLKVKFPPLLGQSDELIILLECVMISHVLFFLDHFASIQRALSATATRSRPSCLAR